MNKSNLNPTPPRQNIPGKSSNFENKGLLNSSPKKRELTPVKFSLN
jgi:hypothetical protein